MSTEYEPFALFDDATWPDRPALLLEDSQQTIEAWTADEVDPTLRQIDAGVACGFIAGGYCAYELGYVFEPKLLSLLPETRRPLLRFHLFRNARRLSPNERRDWVEERTHSDAISGAVAAAVGEAAHGAKVARVRQLIGDGDVYQVNLTFKLKAGGGDPFATYAALRAKARAGGCAFLRFADEDVLSFSPELFFQIDGARIKARPMKGTVARAAGTEDDEAQRASLVADEKQRAENLMIVDLLRNDLARVSKAGSVRVTDLFTVETYPRFHTLTSGIEAALHDNMPFSRVLPALFPCGSVTGAPKIRAMEIIREVEDEPRGVYCGAVGYVSARRSAFNVAIRTLVLRDGGGEMGVGGGIVWDSQPRAEYEESLLKAQFFTKAEEPFRLIETMRWTPVDGFYLQARHLARLQSSARYFGFVCDIEAVRRALASAVALSELPQRVRLTLDARGDIEVRAEDFAPTAPDAVWRFAIARNAVASGDWRVRHKTTARDFYDRAFAEARSATGCDEVVFVNERGEVTEGSRTTLFLERDGLWLTPPLTCGLLDGCLRRELVEGGLGRVVAERVLRLEDLAQGRVWFGNALRGLIRGEAVTANVPAMAAADA